MANYSIDNPPINLELYDTVEFKINRDSYIYVVKGPYLSCDQNYNRKIFDVLDLEAVKFCKKAYGYEPRVGGWPEAYGINRIESRDIPAICRAVWMLFAEINKERSFISIKEFINPEEVKEYYLAKSYMEKIPMKLQKQFLPIIGRVTGVRL